MSPPRSSQLLRQVSARQRLVEWARWFYWILLAMTGVYLGLLLVSRASGWIAQYFSLVTFLAIPAAALVFAGAALVFRRIKPADSARLIDRRMNLKDLFLTVTLLDRSAGEYQPLVVEDAEAKAGTIHPGTVAPLEPPLPRVLSGVGALSVVLAVLLLLPQFDLLGIHAVQEREAQRQERLKEIKEAVAKKVEVLKEKKPEAPLSPEVQKAVEELKMAFQQMKPDQKLENAKLLGDEQKPINDLWRKTSEELLKNQANTSPLAQQFGGMQSAKAQELKKQLENGDASGVKKELEELQKKVEQLQQTKDPAQREALRQQALSQMKDLANALTSQAHTPGMDQALKQALQQMEMAGMPQTSEEALKALQQSLDLTKMEAQSLAQQMRDCKNLEQALKALQAAKQANKQGDKGLDGKDCQGCQSLDDYAKKYGEMCKGEGGWKDQTGLDDGQPGGGSGGGMGRQGIGNGGRAPENPNAQMDFKPEKAKTALTQGKTLMEWKTKGLSEKGDAKEEYRRALTDVKQGVSEAILQEKVPAGMQDTVKQYFDNLSPDKPADGAPAAPAPAETPPAK